MQKTRLSRSEIEAVRVATLQAMLTEGLTCEGIARLSPWLRADSLRKFLAGRRPSQRVAVLLVELLPLGWTYSAPRLVREPEPGSAGAASPSPSIAVATAAATVPCSRCE